MKRCLYLLALLLVLPMILGVAFAGPLVLTGTQRIALPSPDPWEIGTVAIDGNTLLVAAVRTVAPNDPAEYVHGIYLFERASTGRWGYVRPLVEAPGRGSTSVALENGVAAIYIDGGTMIFERRPQGWTRSPFTPPATNSTAPFYAPRAVAGSSVFAGREAPIQGTCVPALDQLEKQANGTWTRTATIGGERCQRTLADFEATRAIVGMDWDFNPSTERPPMRIYADTGAAAWPLVAALPAPINQLFGPDVSIRSPLATVLGRDDQGGTHVFLESGANNWMAAGRILAPEAETYLNSYWFKLRGQHFVQHGRETDFEENPDDFYDQELSVLRVFRVSNDGFDYFAKLRPDGSVGGWGMSRDGRRIAVAAAELAGYTPDNRLFVFELPGSSTQPATQQDNFESGNFARWTPSAGQFSVVSSRGTRVLRQSTLTGGSEIALTAADMTDQAIEADIRPTQFEANDRWFGLVTRRTDAQNYYYVTFRAPSSIYLRRLRNGVISTLAISGAVNFVPGRNYRVRLQSTASIHKVFVDGRPLLEARDTAHKRGQPGIAGYGTRYEADNVVVSPGTRVVLRKEGGQGRWTNSWFYEDAVGDWQLVGSADVEPQTMLQKSTAGEARWPSTVAVDDQAVSMRVRATAYGAAGQDRWIGLMARYVDARNYYYLTLRSSNTLSLRKVVNGTIHVLGTVSAPLTIGTWNDLRLDVIGSQVRAYLNGDLRLEATDTTFPQGRNGIATYKAAAQIATYHAYQP